MRAVVQRCRAARVEVEGQVVGAIEAGLCAFVGAGAGDDERAAAYVVDKIVNLRVFADEQGKMSRSLLDVGGALLVVSQFTLYGDVSKGRRPSFEGALAPGLAAPLLGEQASAAAPGLRDLPWRGLPWTGLALLPAIGAGIGWLTAQIAVRRWLRL